MARIDVTDRKALRNFLDKIAENSRGQEQIIAYAARAAAHTAPILPHLNTSANPGQATGIILSSFRAIAASWVAGTYPTHRETISAAAKAAYTANVSYSAYTAQAAAYAAQAAAYATHSSNAATSATYCAAKATRNSNAAAVRQALEDDAKMLEVGDPISRTPLWGAQGIPHEIDDLWLARKNALLADSTTWSVWTDWYDARLRGGSTHQNISDVANERIEVARVTEIKDEDWRQGPVHVNNKIMEIIERETQLDYRARFVRQVLSEEGENDNISTEDNAVPSDTPASVRAVWDFERQKALLESSSIAVDLQAESIVAELAALREAVKRLCESLEVSAGSNYDRGGLELLRATLQCIPSNIPSSIELSAIIIREVVHERYHSTVVTEWPDSLRAEYEGISISLTAALDLFPERRQRRRVDWSAKLEDLPAVEVKYALEKTNQVLKGKQGQVVVDPAITRIIDERAAALPTEGNLNDPADQTIAMDGIESLHNTAKTLARNAPQQVEVQNVLKGIDDVIADESNALEEGVRSGVRKALHKTGEAAGIARVTERAGRSVWDRVPGLDWLRNWNKGSKPWSEPKKDS